jgi:ATP-dependent RNA helicase RhlE
VQEVLKRAGYKTAVIHADRTQGQRRQALEGFRRGQYRCLVATDIASRGLDVEDVGHVINFDLPHAPEDYVHRIGRTARAGASGRASTFVTERDEETVRAIERIIRMSLPRAEVPREDAVFIEELEEFQGMDDAEPAKPGGFPQERRGKGLSRREAPRRGGSSARGTEPRREREEAPRRKRSGPPRRGEGLRGRDIARGARNPRGRKTGPGKSSPRGTKRPGGKGAGSRGGPLRGTGRSPRGHGGGRRRGR